MEWVYDDGGRKLAGFKGKTGDCCCRAISIATGRPYKEIYTLINEIGKNERVSKRRKGNKYNGHRSSARTGVYTDTCKKVMAQLGWFWHPTMTVGSGCKVHLRSEELPSGAIVCRVAKHFVAVIDGVLHDTWYSAEDGDRCVYGYWAEK